MLVYVSVTAKKFQHISAAKAITSKSTVLYSFVVVVFVTRRYMEKLMTPTSIQDNCKKEFKYSVRRHTEAKMIPVIMEPDMKDSSKWSGPMALELGGTLWVDLSDTALDSGSDGFSRLCDEIDGRLPGRAGRLHPPRRHRSESQRPPAA